MYEENIRWQHKDFKPQKYMISFHAVYFIVIFVAISYYYFKKYQNRNISTGWKPSHISFFNSMQYQKN
jgi:hypothetical protein